MQALLLLASAALLPLPFKHYVWLQGLALWSALVRVGAAAAAHAAAPDGVLLCHSPARFLRLGMQVFVPGAPAELHDQCSLQQDCWVMHTWGALVIGFFLPSAVTAAVWQLGRELVRRRLERRTLRRLRAESAAAAAVYGLLDESPTTPERRAKAAAWVAAQAAAALAEAQHAASDATASQPSSSSQGAAQPLTPSSSTSGLVRSSTDSLFSNISAGSRVTRSSSLATGGKRSSSSTHMGDLLLLDRLLEHPAVLLVPLLARWLLLLIPVGALSFACLEAAARFLPMPAN